jgi:Ca-activated chloride channel family protein
MKIAHLAGQAVGEENRDWAPAIKQLALDYSLMSAFTAFVAVDSASQTRGERARTVPVAVPVPEGVSYHKTVEE